MPTDFFFSLYDIDMPSHVILVLSLFARKTAGQGRGAGVPASHVVAFSARRLYSMNHIRRLSFLSTTTFLRPHFRTMSAAPPAEKKQRTDGSPLVRSRSLQVSIVETRSLTSEPAPLA